MEKMQSGMLDAMRKGDPVGYEQLYDRYSKRIYAMTYGMLQNHTDAEDAVQNTFIHVYEKLYTLKDYNSFDSWLEKIAYNEALLLIRKRKKMTLFNDDLEAKITDQIQDELMLPEEIAERRDTAEKIRSIIAELPEAQRQTLVLFYYNNLKIKQIAEVMNCGENTVKSRLYYARRSIGKAVDDLEKRGEKLHSGAVLPFGELFARLLLEDAGRMDPHLRERFLKQLAKKSGIIGLITAESAAAARITSIVLFFVITAIIVGALFLGGNPSGGSGESSRTGSDDGYKQGAADDDSRRDSLNGSPRIDGENSVLDLLTPAEKEAYSKVLRDNMGRISALERPYKDQYNVPVVFADVYGDNRPEMIYYMQDILTLDELNKYEQRGEPYSRFYTEFDTRFIDIKSYIYTVDSDKAVKLFEKTSGGYPQVVLTESQAAIWNTPTGWLRAQSEIYEGVNRYTLAVYRRSNSAEFYMDETAETPDYSDESGGRNHIYGVWRFDRAGSGLSGEYTHIDTQKTSSADYDPERAVKHPSGTRDIGEYYDYSGAVTALSIDQ
jgi:RNA polymerase sigma factor (sigma-70 family)